ncbi:uncharacterized protein LOC108091852 [Drosophila ficusphila]|uniref:uncharacterized protein LOC108091852 n=1 Tax=Drosophila ficusphila TaxID=30025 RepID=UPI0007E6220C|nr:uncharacterized protein LOC108091852 [Drosophila ficusphila]
MDTRFIFVFCLLIVLAQGSRVAPVAQEAVAETHSAGGVTSGAAISFPENRPSTGSQPPTPAARPVGAPRPAAASRPRIISAAARRQARPSAAGRPVGQNRNRNQKPY